MIPLWIPITLIAGGVWILQDSIASVLYYLKADGEHWHFNHAVRILRACWGIAFLVIGVILL